MVRIGEKVPDFEEDAYENGEMKTVKLSDYINKACNHALDQQDI